MSVEVESGLLGLEPTTKQLAFYSEQSPKDHQKRKTINGFFSEEDEEDDDERSDTSSIGACSSVGEEEEDDEEVQSKDNEENKSSLSSLDSLEDSLPDKRGLSSFYSGKSKSFTSLSNASNATAKDLIKPENPFNKRRRVLMAWSRRRASCGSLISMTSSSFLPPLISSEETLEEGEEGEEEEEFEEKNNLKMRNQLRPSIFTPIWKNDESVKGKMPLRSPRCFSLSDLSKHDLVD